MALDIAPRFCYRVHLMAPACARRDFLAAKLRGVTDEK